MLEDCGIDYSLDSGTLLGVYRDQQVPCWSDSVNLSYRQKDVHHLHSCLYKNNVAFESNILGNHLEFCCPQNRTAVKMNGLVSSLSGSHSCDLHRNIDYRTDDYFPLSRLDAGDRSYPAPRRPERVLEKMYWSDWRVASGDPGPGAGCWSIGL